MNKDTIINLFLKAVGYAAMYGVGHDVVTSKGAGLIVAGATALAAWAASHWHVKKLSNAAGASSPGGSLGLWVVGMGLMGSLGLMGCAGTSAAMFNSEKLAADTGVSAVHAFNQYYAVATNGAAPAKVASLNAARAQVYEGAQKLAATLSVAETLRVEFNTNAAAASMLQATVDDALSQATNLVWLANFLFSNPGSNALVLPMSLYSPVPSNPAPVVEVPASVKLEQLAK